MSAPIAPLPSFLGGPPTVGDEISITGKWVSARPGGRFRSSAESAEMLREWEDVHAAAVEDSGVLSTEINHAVGEEAVLVHRVFRDAAAVEHYFATTAREHLSALSEVARPMEQLVRGVNLQGAVMDAVEATGAPAVFGEYLFGYARDAARPDPATAINVTAQWSCSPGPAPQLDELERWWQQVGTEAHQIEQGLIRFEAYRVVGHDAVLIHEVFDDTSELKFHLTKGTAETYKKDIDQVAEPVCYFFRGPVSWTIRTYSKFMHLPATYSSRGSSFTRLGGSMSDGTTA